MCRGNHLKNIIASKDYLVSKNTFTVVKCNDCGFVFTNPRPLVDELGRYYLSDEYISHNDQANSLMDSIYKVVRNYMLQRKIHWILQNSVKNSSEIRLLDYGCATGEFLLRAKAKGMKTMGIEPDWHAREKARLKGITVIESPDKLPDDDGLMQFDVVTLWHVLEHIPDLSAKKILLEKIVSKDGMLVIAVPEYKSFDARFYKENWAAWDVPRHLNHFEKESLLKLFGDTFHLEKVYPLVFDSFYVSMLSEKNLQNGFSGVIRAFMIGFWSDILAITGRYPFSSQVYIFRKKQ